MTGPDSMSSLAPGGQSGTETVRISRRVFFPRRPILRIHLLGSMRATSYLGDDVLPRSKKALTLRGCLRVRMVFATSSRRQRHVAARICQKRSVLCALA
jgi:hypothetical protein